MRKILFSLLFTFFSLLNAAVGSKTIDLSVSSHLIRYSLLEYEDLTAKMTLKEVRDLSPEKFTLLDRTVASHFFTDSAFWYQLKVENKENRPVSRLIVFEPAWLDSVNLSIVSPQKKIQSYKGGNIYPYSQRAIDHYLVNFKHEFEPGISTLYVQVKTRDPFIVSLALMDEVAFLNEKVSVSIYTAFIYGGIAAMLFYNLFLFLGIRKRYYAYYVFYLSAFFLMNASYNGYTFMYIFSDYPAVQNWVQSTSIYLFLLTGLLFANSFLNLEKYHHRLYNITRYVIFVIIGIAVLSVIIGGYHYHVMLSIILVMLVCIYIFMIALFSWLTGNRAARFFLLGAASGLIGAVITALTVMSFIPYTYMTYKANDFGMFIDVILLSLALVDRMRITHEEKLIAEKQAKTDIVTGLFNRRAYYEISPMEFQRLVRHHRILSVIMFDIDSFKTINDSYGHDAGDIVLNSVGKIVKEVIRKYDYAFRMGGDEFLLLLPETSQEQACILAERIRKKIEDQKILDKNNNKLSLTVSFGIAQYSQKDTSIGDVTRKADEALYQAKKAGRNRVEVLDKFAII